MSQKSRKKFRCKKCDYLTSNKFDWNKHLSTTKHQNGNKMVTNGNKNGNTVLKYACDNCGKEYKYRSGLSRHKKKCISDECDMVLNACRKKSQPNFKAKQSENTQGSALVKQGDILEKLIESQNQMIPKIGNNNNNKISINVFLNEHCKNAMNLTDFIDNIQVSLEDLAYTNEHGYVKGISNIFTKNLTDMKVTERPTHCSDKKRMKFYIKDSDKWEKDKAHEKIDKTIQRITKKQILKIKEWERSHPGFLDNEQLTTEWHRMIYNMMGGENDNIREKHKVNIKRSICENVTVKELISQD